MKLRVTFGIVDPTVAPTSMLMATSEEYFSNVQDIFSGEEYTNDYLTQERNSLILGRGGRILPISDWKPTGLTSSVVSDENGLFSENPKIILNSTQVHSTIGFTFRFDKFRNNWSNIVVRGYYNDILRAEYKINPDNYEYQIEAKIDEWNKLEFEFIKTSIPIRRVRLSNIVFGITRVDDDSTTTGAAKHAIEISPTGEKLPTETFTWTLINFDKEFKPGQTTGVQKYLMEQQQVKFEWGYPVGDEMEWVVGGNYYTTGKPSFQRHKVTLQATSLLNYLTDIYYKGLYRPEGISLYDLAEEILLAAELPLNPDGSHKWKLWDGLKEILTIAPLPKKPMRELLQLIASCGGCVFLPDADGDIKIWPKPAEETEYAGILDTFELGLDGLFV